MDLEKLTAYELVKHETIGDIRSEGYLLLHKKSGARVVVLENDDENKVFSIAFRTPPHDSTGVPHILEHSVLCGSRRFPSKDPFVELVKGSLNTFLNAMTYSDKTMYPVASCNNQDFCNLMHVYLDAVFYPNIYQKEEIFRQEGWSYQLENAEDELAYNGVVYNEMKGAFSSVDDVLEREIMSSLFPDTPYGNESGGDPECIPELSYGEFLDFHRKYYHPSNSYIYLYGDADMAERLEWMDREYLSRFTRTDVDSAIPLQQPFDAPREINKTYPISDTDTEEDNTYLSYNVAVGTSLDIRLSHAMAVLEYALLSSPGAPLKQALLDAGIGKDVEGDYDSGSLQPIFSVIARYANRSQEEEFLTIIRRVLTEQCEQGLNPKALLAGIHSMEFRFREADYGMFPKGLMYGIDLMDSWLYDEERPFDYLKQLEVYAFLKEQVGTGYFEELIRTWLLDNPHASVVIIEPEKGLAAKIEQKTREKLAAYKASLSQAELEALVEQTHRLREFQERPSTQEELAAIPMLSREDLKREIAPLQNEKRQVGGRLLLYHDLFTNGIGYLDLMFAVDDLEADEVPYLGILKAVLGSVNTEHYTYDELTNEINCSCGGIAPFIQVFPDTQNQGKCTAFFGFRAKMLYDKTDFVFRMLEEILFTSSLEDEKRLYEIIAEIKSRMQSALTAGGHTTAAVRAMSYFSPISQFNDQISGIAAYKLAEELEAHFDSRKAELKAKLEAIKNKLFCREGMMISFTAERSALETLEKNALALLEKLPEGKGEKRGLCLPAPEQKNEGFLTQSKIQYVARAGSFTAEGYAYNGALRILKVIMGYEYLWVNIRVKGGAYGCMGGFGRTGDSYVVSYRDPHLSRTNEVFEGIPEYVRSFTVDDRDMLKYIIGTVSELDTPMNPSAKGTRSLNAYMCGISEEDLQRERDEVLDADQESIRALAPLMEAILRPNHFCVIGSEEKIKEERELFAQLVPFVG